MASVLPATRVVAPRSARAGGKAKKAREAGDAGGAACSILPGWSRSEREAFFDLFERLLYVLGV